MEIRNSDTQMETKEGLQWNFLEVSEVLGSESNSSSQSAYTINTSSSNYRQTEKKRNRTINPTDTLKTKRQRKRIESTDSQKSSKKMKEIQKVVSVESKSNLELGMILCLVDGCSNNGRKGFKNLVFHNERGNIQRFFEVKMVE